MSEKTKQKQRQKLPHKHKKKEKRRRKKKSFFFFGGGKKKKKKKDYKQTKMFPPSTGKVCHKKNRATERNKRLAQITLFSRQDDSVAETESSLCLYMLFFRSISNAFTSLLLRLEISNFLSVVFLQTRHFDQSGYAR
jgi:hypothetical protein